MKAKVKYPRIAHLLLSLLFLVNTLILPVSFSDVVLCIGDDHVALEQKNAPADCIHDVNHGLSQLKTQSTYHTDDCVDIPLRQHAQYVVTKKQNHTIHFVHFALITEIIQPANPQTNFSTAAFIYPSLPLQNAVRSVVLLI